MAKGDTLICYCGSEFEATNNRQKYCTNKCAQSLLQRRWRQENPDKVAASARRYKDRHPDRVRVQKAAWRSKNGSKPRGTRTRPITSRMPVASYDPAVYYVNVTHNARLMKAYGITSDQYNQMLEDQGAVCAICGEPETQMVRGKTLRRLCVDHNSTTGRVRALLCAQCNLAVGNFRENPEWFEKAAEYVRFWNQEEPPEGG